MLLIGLGGSFWYTIALKATRFVMERKESKKRWAMSLYLKTRLISIESQPKKIVVVVVVGVVVVHVVAVVIPVVDTRNIPIKVWLKSGF